MPSPLEINASLRSIAHEAVGIALLWHVAIAMVIIAWLAGVRPTRRLAAACLSAPLGSVSVVAFAFGNAFNGAVFAGLFLTLAAFASKAASDRVARGPGWAVAMGSGLVAFGWAYPHFLEGMPALTYLYGAPLGTIPCPTLSAVIGAALMADGFGLKAWRLILAGAGSFYSLFGILRLGVAIDAALLLGSLALIAQQVLDERRLAALASTRRRSGGLFPEHRE